MVYHSFDYQCSAAMATLAYEIHSKIMYCAASVKKNHGDPIFSSHFVLNTVGMPNFLEKPFFVITEFFYFLYDKRYF